MTEKEIQATIKQALRDYPHRLHLLEPVICHFYEKIRRFAYLRLRDDWLAKDVAQNVFGRLLASLRSFKEGSSFRAYLYQIARNEIARTYKKEAQQAVALEPANLFENFSIQKQEQSEKTKIHIEDILSRMKPGHEQILRLYYIDDLKITDLCAILDISPSVAKMRLHRAREQFARLWNQKP